MLLGASQLGESERRQTEEGIHTQGHGAVGDRAPVEWEDVPGVGWEKANWLRDSMLSRSRR